MTLWRQVYRVTDSGGRRFSYAVLVDAPDLDAARLAVAAAIRSTHTIGSIEIDVDAVPVTLPHHFMIGERLL